MKQNPCSIVPDIAKPACIGFDQLDGTVEAFSIGVADSMLTVVEQSMFVSAQHLDDLLDRLQATSHRVIRPSIEEPFGCALVSVTPKVTEVLLDAPGSARFQIQLVQSPKRNSLCAETIRVLYQPCPFAARQWRSARLRQLAVLVLSEPIHGLAKVLGDVKLVMHDVTDFFLNAAACHVPRLAS